MKNTVSRRSFIKNSIVGAVATANISLFVGLFSASAASSACLLYTTKTFQASHSGYATEQAARNAADTVNTGPNSGYWTSAETYTSGPPYPDCTPVSPVVAEPDPPSFTTETSQTLQGLWTFVKNGTIKITACSQN